MRHLKTGLLCSYLQSVCVYTYIYIYEGAFLFEDLSALLSFLDYSSFSGTGKALRLGISVA